MKTILITGASSGIGKTTAEYFAQHGWNVAATMRRPEKEESLQKIKNINLFKLDVSDQQTIDQAISETIKTFGGIDVLFNNAGYGLVGPFENLTEEQIKKQFEVNLFGVMRVTHSILPYFRENKKGMIITTSSMGGRITFPLYSSYHATKWAVEGFMESLQFELKRFNIQIKLIEPGSIKTDFYERSMETPVLEKNSVYEEYFSRVNANMNDTGSKAPGPEVVAKKVFQAANDTSYHLRYPVGGNGPLLIFLRWFLPLPLFQAIVASVTEKKR